MDLRVWQWRNPWEKRISLFYYFFYLCLLLRQHATATETGYNQEHKSEIPDPDKLDSLSNFLPYESREDVEYKRGSAFFPLRGKKSSTDDSVGGHQLFSEDDVEEKRSQFFPLRGKKIPDEMKRASYFMPMRGRKNDEWTAEDYDITGENPSKRASSFMPMRGKKKYADISDYVRKSGTYLNDINPPISHRYQNNDKRMPYFVPVRGKRSYKEEEVQDSRVLANDSYDDNIFNHSTVKRSISFMPMRGKKEFTEGDETSSTGIVTSLLEKKKHSFMPMRGRLGDDYYKGFSELKKKASTFMPMRGRRYSNDGNIKNFDVEKMAESGTEHKDTQGLKTSHDFLYDVSNFPDLEYKINENKKSSFMPMRGRRTVSLNSDDFTASENSNFNIGKKRSSFTPMRGRRSVEYSENEDNPQNSLLRKKRSNFYAMRGRTLEDQDFKVEPWPIDQMREHRLVEYSKNEDNRQYPLIRKKKSEFIGMRGRTLEDQDFEIEPWHADQMRGRRLIEDLEKKVNPQHFLIRNNNSMFYAMRGRTLEDQDFKVEPWPADQMREHRLIELSENEDNPQYPLIQKKESEFIGMRGRTLEDRDFEVEPWPAYQLYSLLDKKSKSFVPMRGRSVFDEDVTVAPWPADQLMSLLDKKSVPIPVNGERINNDNNEHKNSDTRMDNKFVKRGSSFVPVRGRRLRDNDSDFHYPYPYLMAGIGSSLMAKPYSDKGVSFRSAISEARRKKFKVDWDSVKRAFHAARGKRFNDIDGYINSLDGSETLGTKLSSEDSTDSLKNESEKMRVKRSVVRPRVPLQNNRQYIALKRPMSFFATRGKRLDDSVIDSFSQLR